MGWNLNWSKGWVEICNFGEEAAEHDNKLNGFRRGATAHGIVETTESVVIDKPQPPTSLWYQANRAHLYIW